MSLDVSIRQRLFGSKSLPLEVILGGQLAYGNYRNDCLEENVLGEAEFLAYDPEHIGRGFSVVWTPGEKKQVSLRLLHPTGEKELEAFYKTVQRIAEYWGGTLIVDGKRSSLKSFLSTYQDALEFNASLVKKMLIEEVLSGEHVETTLYCAKWTLTVGRKEAELFAANPKYFETWLHEQQTVSASYGASRLFRTEKEYVGIFACKAGTSYVFPNPPLVPYGLRNDKTGKDLKKEEVRWLIWLDGCESDGLRELPYESFLERVPAAKKSNYDTGHILVEGLTEEELRALSFDAQPVQRP